MNTVGLFAGRGDVVLAMGIAFILGMLTGFYVTTKWYQIKTWWNTRKGKQ